MNVQAIQLNEDYAYVSYRKRGQFQSDAIRVTVIAKGHKKYVWNSNKTGVVTIRFIRPHDGATIEQDVDARNIIDYWDEYEAQLEHWRKERDAHRARIHAENVRRQQEVVVVQAYMNRKLGIPHHAVSDVTPESIVLHRSIMESHLDIKYDAIEQMQQMIDEGTK